MGNIIGLCFYVLAIVGLWQAFEKAGQPGWGAFIPIYNTYLMCLIAGKPGWWTILFFIPIVNIVIGVLIAMDIAHNFGKGTYFGIGLWLFGFIFYPILGFGSARYRPIQRTAQARVTSLPTQPESMQLPQTPPQM